MMFQHRRLTSQNILRCNGMNLCGFIVTIFKDADARKDLSRVQHELSHLQQHILHRTSPRGVKRACRANFPHPNHHHLGQSTLYRPRKAGVQLDSIEHKHTVGFQTMPIHEH